MLTVVRRGFAGRQLHTLIHQNGVINLIQPVPSLRVDSLKVDIYVTGKVTLPSEDEINLVGQLRTLLRDQYNENDFACELRPQNDSLAEHRAIRIGLAACDGKRASFQR